MKKLLLNATLAGLMGAAALTAQAAEWEQVTSHPGIWTSFIDSNGTFFLADLVDDNSGGIYRSTDKGSTWSRCGVRDYDYTNFVEAGGYIFAPGLGCRLARSANGGASWQVINYGSIFKDVLEQKAINGDVAYGMATVGERLYLSSFGGGGVVYTDDWGQTWTMTDRESMLIHVDGVNEPIMDRWYTLANFNDTLVAFGMYSIQAYDAEADQWSHLNMASNFMSSVLVENGTLYGGRSMENQDPNTPFIVTTTDLVNWDGIERTPFTDNLNLRALGGDGNGGIFAGLPNIGICYTPDRGENWFIFDGNPGYYPLAFMRDEEYVYCSVYTVPGIWGAEQGGLWRYPLSELTALDRIVNDGASGFTFDGTTLRIDLGGSAAVTVADLAGRSQRLTMTDGALNLEQLAPGTYVFAARTAQGVVTGKFQK